MHILYNAEKKIKRVVSPNYNYHFNGVTGEFARWGATFEDNPKSGALEIFDLEVSEVCSGIPSIGSDVAVPCSFCYKTNTRVGRLMSFDTFKTIFNKLPQTLTQIAFGIGDIGAHGDYNDSDLVRMFQYCRNNDWNPGVVPNLTINGWGLTDEWADTLVANCGAIAVSRYANKDVCYDAVKKLTDRGLTQTNIHMVVSEESMDACYDLVNDSMNDPRLAKLNAIVFLTLKPKGKRNKWNTVLDINKYRDLINYAMDNGVRVGMDSCGAKKFLVAMKDHKNFDQFCQLVESCESTLFSGYANVLGHFYPCSFTEEEPGWETGIDLTQIEDFNRDVWQDKRVVAFREANLATTDETVCSDCRSCVTFPELNGDKKVIPIKEIA